MEKAYVTLNKAFDWGEKYGVGILLDFHAHNGSQNGYGTGCSFCFVNGPRLRAKAYAERPLAGLIRR